jgi:hypothetical protein
MPYEGGNILWMEDDVRYPAPPKGCLKHVETLEIVG